MPLCEKQNRMKKKFTSNLTEKKMLPLPLYFLEQQQPQKGSYILKFEQAKQLNSTGFELHHFYKAISKF